MQFYSQRGGRELKKKKKMCSLCDGECSHILGSPLAFLAGGLLELPESPLVRRIVFSMSSHWMGIVKNSSTALHLTSSLIFLDCSLYLPTGNCLCEVHIRISFCIESMRKHDRKQLQVAWSVWMGDFSHGHLIRTGSNPDKIETI